MQAASFKIRAVQLDLARQMETLDFIRRFIHFIAANGYNTLVLYLEGRIRTASFPYPSQEEGYTPREMAQIVREAADAGIQVIPVISTLGHAHQFLMHPQLRHLSETREGFVGRFGAQTDDVFCPSQPQTYQFLEAYLSEIAGIFPSSFIHAGGDEAWDIARCDLCRARLASGQTQSDLFAAHLQEIHRIITGKLGRRVIIWDDMFEYYPEALQTIPRDIVMACWHYDPRVENTKSHFFNRAVADALATYDHLGFDYLICPADGTLANSETFTAYASRHKPVGGLVTTWEKGTSFMLQSMPLIAAVGRAWEAGATGDFTPFVRQAAADLFGLHDDLFLQAIQAICNSGLARGRRTRLDAYLTRRENNPDLARPALVDLLLTCLPEYRQKVKPESRDILEEILLSLRSEQITHHLEQLLPAFFVPDADHSALTARLQEIIPQVEQDGHDWVALWRRVRPGILPCKVETLYQSFLANLRQVPALAARSGALSVHFMLPDQYSAQRVKILIRYADAPAWEEIGQGIFKDVRHFDCFYSRLFPIAKDRTPAAVRVETCGFGGQGFTFLQAHNDKGRFIPAAITRVVGNVADPQNLLAHDWKWAFAGERDTAKPFYDDALANALHGFDVELRAAE